MDAASYTRRRDEVAHYFDRSAHAAWARLTSDAPLGRIRATVRAGRDRMRATLLDWLPADLRGRRLLDAGCGTGALAVEAARRGAEVLAVDVSPKLVRLAQERAAAEPDGATLAPRLRFVAGDMLAPEHGGFDHVVAMDSLIHYGTDDAVRALAAWAPRTGGSLLFTFAPRTPALAAMHAVGRLFPRGDRAPAIVPVAPPRLAQALGASIGARGWQAGRTLRVASGFYTSQACEWHRSAA